MLYGWTDRQTDRQTDSFVNNVDFLSLSAHNDPSRTSSVHVRRLSCILACLHCFMLVCKTAVVMMSRSFSLQFSRHDLNIMPHSLYNFYLTIGNKVILYPFVFFCIAMNCICHWFCVEFRILACERYCHNRPVYWQYPQKNKCPPLK